MKYLSDKETYNHKDFMMDRIYETLDVKFNYYKSGKTEYLSNVRREMKDVVEEIDEILDKFKTIKNA
tara:strand:+ start:5410 stop:5610 length:201 start_codon:yes stop_codon:yes gene_type:complete